jgi:signal transduction histidine kinase
MKTDEKSRRLVRTGRADYPAAIITQQAQHKAIQHNREMDLYMDTPPIDGILAIDADNLARIIMEIVDNAFKFSRPGEQVHVAATRDGDMLHIVVRDQGWGMTPEEIEAIGAYMQFERAFFEQQGLGFGLTIASRMTEVHEGTFHIESTPGESTAVHVRLPFVS